MSGTISKIIKKTNKQFIEKIMNTTLMALNKYLKEMYKVYKDEIEEE